MDFNKQTRSIAVNTNYFYGCPNCDRKSGNGSQPFENTYQRVCTYKKPNYAKYEKCRCDHCFERQITDISYEIAMSVCQEFMEQMSNFKNECAESIVKEKCSFEAHSFSEMSKNDSTYPNVSTTSNLVDINLSSCHSQNKKEIDKDINSDKTRNKSNQTENMNIKNNELILQSDLNHYKSSNENLNFLCPESKSSNLTDSLIEVEGMDCELYKCKNVHDNFEFNIFQNNDPPQIFKDNSYKLFNDKPLKQSFSKEKVITNVQPKISEEMSTISETHFKQKCSISETQLNRCASELLNIRHENEQQGSSSGAESSLWKVGAEEQFKNQQKLHNLLLPSPGKRSDFMSPRSNDGSENQILETDESETLIENFYFLPFEMDRDTSSNNTHNNIAYNNYEEIINIEPPRKIKHGQVSMESILEGLIKEEDSQLNILLKHIHNESTNKSRILFTKGSNLNLPLPDFTGLTRK